MPTPFEIAKGFAGQREGAQNKLLNDFLNGNTQGMTSAQFAWCSRFVKQAASQAGYDTGKANDMARSWLDVGQPVDKPEQGDVAVYSRGNGMGHVGFVSGLNPDGTVRLLSGNDGNMVRESNRDSSRLLGYRRLSPFSEGQQPTQTAQAAPPAPTEPFSATKAAAPKTPASGQSGGIGGALAGMFNGGGAPAQQQEQQPEQNPHDPNVIRLAQEAAQKQKSLFQGFDSFYT